MEKKWYAVFNDYRDLSFGVLQADPLTGGSYMTGSFEVVEKYALDQAIKELEDAKAEVERLREALRIAANQLAGIALCFEVHGTNLNVAWLINEYKNNAKKARQALRGEGAG